MVEFNSRLLFRPAHLCWTHPAPELSIVIDPSSMTHHFVGDALMISIPLKIMSSFFARCPAIDFQNKLNLSGTQQNICLQKLLQCGSSCASSKNMQSLKWVQFSPVQDGSFALRKAYMSNSQKVRKKSVTQKELTKIQPTRKVSKLWP